ncbi:MAG: pyruvate dehydrogenase complex dihydrolipoamide acetyltransferase [Candidatus Didemnitutus sp.]|nr:pyruvate dehydrogenase complex dihydrolipoamide acetyltransferase [Candidatus Didemnitutus sp.]
MANIIDMPKLSDTMTVGTLIKWLKKEGDAVQSGDILAEVETDKATMELESFFDGTLVKIFTPEGAQIAVGAPLCAIGEKGEKVDAPAAAKADGAKPAADAASTETEQKESHPEPEGETAPAPVAAPAATPTPVEPAEPAAASPAGRTKISPLARKLASINKLDPARLTGTGPHGRVVKADVLAAVADSSKLKSAPAAAGAPPAKSNTTFSGGTPARTGPIQEARTVAATNMRATIAKRLLEAKTQIPHFYLEIEVDAEPLLAVRADLNAAFEKEGVKLSVNDFILKASAEALRRVPGVNASWTGTGIQYHGAAHVSFAVAIEDGLITPVIRDTHTKSVFAISAEVKPLGKRAKEKKLKPDEFTGGTFCVSNLGMMGIERFSAIINPPNAAILAVGTTVTKPVVKNGAIVVGQTMVLTLSCDHRVVDGALGAQFLAAMKDLLEKPALLLV